ncbi:MAG: PstS family phosphate ABC transporter substrate-binding protein [Candidatus Eisenbacteria bacterium]
MKALALVLSICLLLAGAVACPAAESQPSELAGTITLSGAWALYPMAIRWAEEFTKIHPNVHIDIGAGGAGKGMADALAGAVDLGMVSRDVYPAEIERGAWWVSVTRDAVVPVVSSLNPIIDRLLKSGATREELSALWLGDAPGTWGELEGGDFRQPVRVYTRSDACGAAKTWASYLGGEQEDLHGVGVYGDPGLADAVRRDALGIGYNNINYVYDTTTGLPVAGLSVLPIDTDGDGAIGEGEDFYSTRDEVVAAIAVGLYPSPPARDLHLVSGGRPGSDLVIEFLRWVLADGQRYIHEAGYVTLPEEKLKEQWAKLGSE